MVRAQLEFVFEAQKFAAMVCGQSKLDILSHKDTGENDELRKPQLVPLGQFEHDSFMPCPMFLTRTPRTFPDPGDRDRQVVLPHPPAIHQMITPRERFH